MHNLIIKKIWNVIQFKRGAEAHFRIVGRRIPLGIK
jgi:hypothetical protein